MQTPVRQLESPGFSHQQDKPVSLMVIFHSCDRQELQDQNLYFKLVRTVKPSEIGRKNLLFNLQTLLWLERTATSPCLPEQQDWSQPAELTTYGVMAAVIQQPLPLSADRYG